MYQSIIMTLIYMLSGLISKHMYAYSWSNLIELEAVVGIRVLSYYGWGHLSLGHFKVNFAVL